MDANASKAEAPFSALEGLVLTRAERGSTTQAMTQRTEGERKGRRGKRGIAKQLQLFKSV